MILVLNEWVFHDLLFENGDPAFQETARFLVAFGESEDILVIPGRGTLETKGISTHDDVRPPPEISQQVVAQSDSEY